MARALRRLCEKQAPAEPVDGRVVQPFSGALSLTLQKCVAMWLEAASAAQDAPRDSISVGFRCSAMRLAAVFLRPGGVPRVFVTDWLHVVTDWLHGRSS